jgi:hypothetical protein
MSFSAIRWHSFAFAYVVCICSLAIKDSSIFRNSACRCADDLDRCLNLGFAPAIAEEGYEEFGGD